MGACFVHDSFDMVDTKKLGDLYRSWQDQDRYENGHSGYSGGVGTLAGLRISRKATFPDANAAINWLSDNTEKRGDAVAVKYMAPVLKVTKAPTFGPDNKVATLPVHPNWVLNKVPAEYIAQENQSWAGFEGGPGPVGRYGYRRRLYIVFNEIPSGDQLELQAAYAEKSSYGSPENVKRFYDLHKKLGLPLWDWVTEQGERWMIGGWAAC